VPVSRAYARRNESLDEVRGVIERIRKKYTPTAKKIIDPDDKLIEAESGSIETLIFRRAIIIAAIVTVLITGLIIIPSTPKS